jgi:hypothetical protein
VKRPARFCALALAAGLPLAGIGGGCAEAPESLALRALHSSGPLSFVCLSAPSTDPNAVGLPLSKCSGARRESLDDYSVPHLYALVTQPVRGEVAVIDLTTETDAVLDADPGAPGAQFLPVGARPTDIVSTPGGTATFVAVAEPRFEGIFALPSFEIRGGRPRLSSWPVCSLPETPGAMVLAVDPDDDAGAIRPRCDAAYGADDEGASCEGVRHCHGDLAKDAEAAGTPGRYKLVVALPARGGLAIIDAQAILDQEDGAFEPCPIERFIALEAAVPPAEPAPGSGGAAGACAQDPPPTAAPGVVAFLPEPAGLTFDGTRLYVADLGAPLIHRLDLGAPCEPVVLPPLVPRSAAEPERPVVTSRVAVSPPTMDFKRYLYAIDVVDGSMLVFDVSDDGGSAVPLARSRPELNPFLPVDRIQFAAPPRDIVILETRADVADDTTGATAPLRCDPDPKSTSPAVKYRTASDYKSGAGPTRLRGIFAFVVLTSGDLAILDVDDYDAPCRGPRDEHALFGCFEASPGTGLATSAEYSCNTVEPHQARSSAYLVHLPGTSTRIPGLQTFVQLFDETGGLVSIEGKPVGAFPFMRATVPADAPPSLPLVVGNDLFGLDTASGLLETEEGVDRTAYTLAFNLEEPRVHGLDQAWTVTYEGALPGFVGRFAHLVPAAGGTFELREPTSRFCGAGVLGESAQLAAALAAGTGAAEAAKLAEGLADYVQIASSVPSDTDPYWSSQTACTFTACSQHFGSHEAPRTSRDLRILEATDDRLVVEPRAPPAASAPELPCCFPGVVEFRVRAGGQWVVVGSVSGFLHDVRVDASGVCRPSCKPELARLGGRVREAPTPTSIEDAVSDTSPFAFQNPFFRFAIQAGGSRRDMQFAFDTLGGFRTLAVSLVTTDPNVQPQAVRLLEPTGEIAVTDGSLEGLTLVGIGSLAVTRQYR